MILANQPFISDRMTRTELLVPSEYDHTSVLSILEYMAECGQCKMFDSQDKGVCVTSKKMTMAMVEVDMPWSVTCWELWRGRVLSSSRWRGWGLTFLCKLTRW